MKGNKFNIQRWLIALITLLSLIGLLREQGIFTGHVFPAAKHAQSESDIAKAFRLQQSDVQVSGKGRVVRLLPDDVKGSRHQRFILQLDKGLTILIAHNIDLAPRIDNLSLGDVVSFYGEYEWNEQGGVVHWTHHDPKGRHSHGYLEHKGRRYQ